MLQFLYTKDYDDEDDEDDEDDDATEEGGSERVSEPENAKNQGKKYTDA